MKKWVVFVELTDEPKELGLELNESTIRELFDQVAKELPPSIGCKIRSIAGPFEVGRVRSAGQ